eukprot:gene27697-34187_t
MDLFDDDLSLGEMKSDEEDDGEPGDDELEDEDDSEQPEWLHLFKTPSSPAAVVAAWLSSLSADERTAAEADPHAARFTLRTRILASRCKEVRDDKTAGFKRTGAILRALDESLGIPARSLCNPKLSTLRKDVPLEVLPGDGTPGTLGVWWSNFKIAEQGTVLKAHGVTHRLNCAVELVEKFPDDGLKTVHVPMEDFFSTSDPESNTIAQEEWTTQLPALLAALRSLRDEGAVVNINCKMGKNRSGVAVLLWLCCEEGWDVNEAVEHLRRISMLALGNPVLLKAAIGFLGYQGEVQLTCPAPDTKGT